MTLVYVRTRGGRAMVKARIGIAAASVAVVAGGLLAAFGATAAGAAASCSSPGKCFLTTVDPQSVAAGDSQTFTFTVKNEATTQTLGSVQVTAPAGFTITNASAPVGNASYTASSALFLNLGLSPTQSATLSVQASAPCSSAASGWSVEAKQSNQFNGPNNTFVLDSGSSLGATVSGSCSLAFLTEPAGGLAGSPITSQVGQPAAANPVSVEVLGGDNKVVTSSSAVITLAIGANPGSGTLSGTTQVQASQGVASFANLVIDQTGWPYTLVATSPGITPQPSATSSFFGIYGAWLSCSGGPCSGSSQTKTTTGTVTTSSATSGQFLGVGLGGVTFACGGSYQPLSDPLNFDVLNPSGTTSNALFTVTLEISKQLVQSSGHPGASSWQVCFGSNVPFPAQLGTSLGPIVIGGVNYYTGLLLDCTNSTPANTPCVLSRNKDNAGNVIVTFLGYGDTMGRL
jgi:hypothetical protein